MIVQQIIINIQLKDQINASKTVKMLILKTHIIDNLINVF